ncbi:MAG: NAD-dependent epimerase/dehydratase family protein [Candidatus Thorarchaeota archaeon]
MTGNGSMRVLITGSFGNVGESTLLELLKRNHEIRCFDIDNPDNRKKRKELLRLGEFQTVWGDIRSSESVREAIQDVDLIIHLAAIIPPATDANPELARNVNLGGTVNILEEAKRLGSNPRIVYASSVATYGHCTGEGPPKTANDPQVATDVYTETKIESEAQIKGSGLPWTIFRFAAVPPLSMDWFGEEMSALMFEIPLNQRIEFIHTRDIGLALANSVDADVANKVLLLGGGPNCRMFYREFMSRTLGAVGLDMLPDSAFKVPKCDEDYFHTDWMDTVEAQELLKFQTRDFDDYLEDLKKAIGFRRHFVKIFRSMAIRRMLNASPYHYLPVDEA